MGFKIPGHQKGVSEVLRVICNPNMKGFLMIGVIDRDKKMPPSIDSFEQINQSGSMYLLRSKTNIRHFLITHPCLENWLYEEEANAVQINPSDFGFGSKSYFKEVAKSEGVHKNQKFKDFLNALKQKNAPGVTSLSEWFTELSEK